LGGAPGECTADTSRASATAEIAATGADLRDAAAQDAVVARWLGWAQEAKDIGNQTRQVLFAVGDQPTAAEAARVSRELHERTGHTAGNGSLMRTAPVALAYLDDEAALADAARQLSTLTHFDPEAGEACVLWSLAIRHAVLTGAADVRRGLQQLSPDRQRVWAERLDVAEHSTPADFTRNGWVVEALQAAWSSISTTTSTDANQVREALEAAVRGGRDTDTVAAITGGLIGAVHGASAVPSAWRRILHGWPGYAANDLISLCRDAR
jgi:ADP-ribosylglycohydrolase